MTGQSASLTAVEQAALGAGLAQAVSGQASQVAGTGDIAPYLRMVSGPGYPLPAAIGFVAGFIDGFLAGAKDWRRDLEAVFRLAGVGVKVSLAEFFVRPIVEANPQGLSPQVVAELETLRAMHRMRDVITWLEKVGPDAAISALRDVIPDADDIATMIGRATEQWWQEQLLTTPDALASGRHIGQLLGGVALELIRAFCEPDVFAVGEALEVSYDEHAKEVAP